MHSRFRMKGVSVTALAALLALLVVPATLLALPKPGAPGRSFRLMARAIGAITINRVYCGLSATGEVCVDSSGSSTIGGGFWPKGSPQQYVFNSGLQAAGIVDSNASFPWAGDVTGAFFFDPKGTTQHGEQVEPIWNSGSAADKAAWPAGAYVPHGDAEADIYDPNLQLDAFGHPVVAASQADIWTLAWDGNPGQNAGRSHPLGIAVETRGMGWNFPAFNNDIVYFTYTFYNITSDCDTSYVNIRPSLRDEIRALGTRFHELNNAAFGITIPQCGYTIKDFYANFSADMDVSSSAGSNYSSVNLPFSLGYVYQASFQAPDNNFKLPPDMGSAPFLNGYGFVGVKYLQSPKDSAGHELGIKLFSNTVNGGLFGDPPNVQALYRYVTGNVSPALGDGNCNFRPTIDRICYVKEDGSDDMRFFQSSGPQNLVPGGQGTIVVAYVFASAVKVGGCPVAGCGGVEILPGDPTHLTDATYLATTGANTIDSMTGFLGYTDNAPIGQVDQSEFKLVPGSLLAKSLVAQTVFDNKFLLPQSPASPEFFLVPGDDQVTVLWRKSQTETGGDLYYAAASQPKVLKDPDGSGPLPAALVNNLLYDPNYRQFDVQGYRVYRGRVDNPTSLTMLAQFDYAGRTMDDYLGAVQPLPNCAPELRFAGAVVKAGCTGLDTAKVGLPFVGKRVLAISSPFVQVKLGDRTMLATGDAVILAADTAVTGNASGKFPAMTNGGVPFTYVDGTAKNNLRYFYSVTAFDINSIQSGPSSLESARVTKAVTPVHPASNSSSTGGVTSIAHSGRGLNTDSMHPTDPTIDPATGVFSGPARPATAAALGFVGTFLSKVVASPGQMAITLDSMHTGSAYDNATVGPAHLFYNAGGTTIDVSYYPSQNNATSKISASFQGDAIDQHLANRYGGDSSYHLQGQFTMTIPGTYQNMVFGRGCVNGNASGSSTGHKGGLCGYDGARWFSTATESFAHPTQGNPPNDAYTTGGPFATITNYTNAGSVAGVDHIFEPRSYQNGPNVYRNLEGVMATVATAADYRVYWGTTPGTVDSVIDITHNVAVDFDSTAKRGYTWGFLTTAATGGAGSGDGRPGVLTVTDLGCVNPFHSFGATNGVFGCAGTTHYNFVNTAAAGSIAMGNGPTGGGVGGDPDTPARPNAGFGMYLAGHFFLFELSAPVTLPSAPAVWTMRSYLGAIDGGGGADSTDCPDTVCTAGHFGNYTFKRTASPLTAVHSGLVAKYTSSNLTSSITNADLSLVHTIPDPYYVTNGFERSSSGKVIKFVNLPTQAIIRIYSTSGVLVRVLEHSSANNDGSMDWDVRNRNNQVVASGVYFYAIEATDARRVGRMTIVNFAQ